MAPLFTFYFISQAFIGKHLNSLWIGTTLWLRFSSLLRRGWKVFLGWLESAVWDEFRYNVTGKSRIDIELFHFEPAPTSPSGFSTEERWIFKHFQCYIGGCTEKYLSSKNTEPIHCLQKFRGFKTDLFAVEPQYNQFLGITNISIY